MRNQLTYVLLILCLFAGSMFVALPIDHPVWLEEGLAPGPDTQRDIRELTLGLDLKGGTQVLLEAEISEDQPLPEDALNSAKIIVEQRVNGLGLAEPTVQLQGESRMIVELPGVKNPDQASRRFAPPASWSSSISGGSRSDPMTSSTRPTGPTLSRLCRRRSAPEKPRRSRFPSLKTFLRRS